ncbi:MAG: 1,4-alpha-glucan branching protein GlgB [Firmicutes bacterium]|nr:1,4-alpha-glucan branching protein GlgB [Bacillota bacterium]
MNENLPKYLFHQGTNYSAYTFMGSHFVKDSKTKVVFRVFAPNAKSVSVIGDFNNWNDKKDIMQKLSDEGIYEITIDNCRQFQSYKYCIVTKKNKKLLKADPYAFHSETRGATASKIYDIDKEFDWKDKNFFEYKKRNPVYQMPLNIYEVNLASWKKTKDGNFYDYKKAAHELCEYVKEMGYTHVELMPVSEYPLDDSWGYQVTGYYSVTSRFGTPHDFMYFVDYMHQNGVGVILDWVPAHFPKDDFGLIEFDGSFLYECQNKNRMEHKGWGTRIFDYGRNEVQSFLVSNAVFWMDKYHIDGLRVDAVASMLYLDYGRLGGEWEKNSLGTNINLEAVAFFQKLNKEVFQRYPEALMIAEESTAFPKITVPVDAGGLGFNFKWNMGWMNDTLEYIKTNPLFRAQAHNKLTFSFHYAFSENFILPISHDEVVHGKKSLLDKMPGGYAEKFANDRAYLTFMIAHPGKKLLFMGSEIGHFIEWDFKKQIDWFLLGYSAHNEFKHFVKSLNHFYLRESSLWEQDCNPGSFKWIVGDDVKHNVISFLRIDKNGNELIFIGNFADSSYKDYRIGCKPGRYSEIFNTDQLEFGGKNRISTEVMDSEKISMHGYKHSIKLNLPPLSAMFLKKTEEELKL